MDVVCHSWTLPWKFKNASNGMSCAEGVDFEWYCSYIKMEVWRIETFSSSQPSWHNQSNKNFFLLKTFDSLNQFIFGPKRTGKRSSFEKVAVVGNMAGFIWTRSTSPLRPRIPKAWRCQIFGCHKLSSNTIYWDLRQGGNQSDHVHVSEEASIRFRTR